MVPTYLLIGGNLGERERVQAEALLALEKGLGRIGECSALYESAPWGFDHERYFLNRVVRLDTELSPEELLEGLLHIEAGFGRERSKEKGYEGRLLDLDILYYGERIVAEPELRIPHPRLHERRFTLLPLAEIAGELFDPLREKRVRALLEACEDPLEVKVFDEGWITST